MYLLSKGPVKLISQQHVKQCDMRPSDPSTHFFGTGAFFGAIEHDVSHCALSTRHAIHKAADVSPSTLNPQPSLKPQKKGVPGEGGGLTLRSQA